MTNSIERKLVPFDSDKFWGTPRYSMLWENADGSYDLMTDEEATEHLPWEVREEEPSLADDDPNGPRPSNGTFGERSRAHLVDESL